MIISNRFLIFLLILAAAATFGFFLTWPQYQDFQIVQAEVESKQAELDSKTAYYSDLWDIWRQLETYKEILPKIDSALPDSYSLPATFHSLQKVFSENGFFVNDIRSDGVASEEAKEIRIHIVAAGRYPSLKSLFLALEDSERFFEVKSVSFSSPEKGDIFSFKLIISTYIY